MTSYQMHSAIPVTPNGYWTEYSEAWFQKCRQDILADKAMPLNGNEWQNILKWQRHILDLVIQSLTELSMKTLPPISR